jgi:aldehyde:ferredoxin oxidoreductase
MPEIEGITIIMSNLYGWTGKILRVDLSSNQISTVDTEKYARRFIGGKGLMHRLAWEEIPRGTGAFDADNRLMIATGPLTGTPAPTSGRVEIGGVAPQCHPEMYSHSGVGGWFGAELKYAGFDAVIIQGKATSPCYLWINDGNVEIMDAKKIWGLGTYGTQQELQKKHGRNVKSLVIGPAGENKSRIAVLLTDNNNAAGQGGFGGVAGSKNLKAICVKGSQSVRIAHPNELLKLLTALTPEKSKNPAKIDIDFEYDAHIIKEVPYQQFKVACTHACNKYCMSAFKDVQKATRPGLHNSQVGCIGTMIIGWQNSMTWTDGTYCKWPLWNQNLERGTEALELINEYGLNQFELLGGMIPWIVMASHEGIITEKDLGFSINPDDPEWWVKSIRIIAYREGFGDILAEGTTRAINMLGEDKYGESVYTGYRKTDERKMPTPISLQQAWGYAAHWGGRGVQASVPYPDWLLRALTWMTQTRDSNNDTHHRSRPEWLEEFRKDPYRGELGPQMAIWDENRSELKCALTLCDWAFPNPYVVSAEAGLYSAVTGIETSQEELDRIGERLKNMQRAVLIRNHDRTRKLEVNEILPFYKRPDGSKGISIDEDEFAIMVDHYYEQRGWDKVTGWPTRSKLLELDLQDVADELSILA